MNCTNLQYKCKTQHQTTVHKCLQSVTHEDTTKESVTKATAPDTGINIHKLAHTRNKLNGYITDNNTTIFDVNNQMDNRYSNITQRNTKQETAADDRTTHNRHHLQM